MLFSPLPQSSPRETPLPATPAGKPRRRKVILPPLCEYLARVPDPRDPRGRRQAVVAILTLLCFGYAFRDSRILADRLVGPETLQAGAQEVRVQALAHARRQYPL